MKEKEPRYCIQRYGRYNFIIIDLKTGYALRKPGKEHLTNVAYDEDGPVFLVYNKIKDAMQKCKELNA